MPTPTLGIFVPKKEDVEAPQPVEDEAGEAAAEEGNATPPVAAAAGDGSKTPPEIPVAADDDAAADAPRISTSEQAKEMEEIKEMPSGLELPDDRADGDIGRRGHDDAYENNTPLYHGALYKLEQSMKRTELSRRQVMMMHRDQHRQHTQQCSKILRGSKDEEDSNTWVALNFNGLPINEMNTDYGKVRVDARTLLDVVNGVTMSQQHLTHVVHRLDRSVSTLMTQQQQILELIANMNQRLSETEDKNGMLTPNKGHEESNKTNLGSRLDEPVTVQPFMPLYDRINNTKDSEIRFIMYHIDGLKNSHDKFKDKENFSNKKEKERIRNNMKKLEKFSNNMIRFAHLGELSKRPTKGPWDLIAWEEKVRSIAKTAMLEINKVMRNATYTRIRDYKWKEEL